MREFLRKKYSAKDDKSKDITTNELKKQLEQHLADSNILEKEKILILDKEVEMINNSKNDVAYMTRVAKIRLEDTVINATIKKLTKNKKGRGLIAQMKRTGQSIIFYIINGIYKLHRKLHI